MGPHMNYETRKPKAINYNDAITIRLSKDFKEKLIAAGKELRKPVSNIIREAVDEYLQKYQKKPYWSPNMTHPPPRSKEKFLK